MTENWRQFYKQVIFDILNENHHIFKTWLAITLDGSRRRKRRLCFGLRVKSPLDTLDPRANIIDVYIWMLFDDVLALASSSEKKYVM